MSLLLAMMLAAGPAPVATDVADKKPRKKCEYISEVGSNRPRRVCQIIQPKAPAEQAKTDAAKQTSDDHSQHEAGAEE